jgi:hypothetical protein
MAEVSGAIKVSYVVRFNPKCERWMVDKYFGAANMSLYPVAEFKEEAQAKNYVLGLTQTFTFQYQN